jgi:hypothetical protein
MRVSRVVGGATLPLCDDPRMQRLRQLLATALLAATTVAPLTTSAAPSWHTWVGTPTDVFRTGQYD